jgi:hypothetical protein
MEAPAQADARAGRELRRKPLLVEPDRVDLPRTVVDARANDREPSAGTAHGHVAHNALDGNLLLGEEVGDSALRDGRLVAPRRVRQQIVDRLQAELAELARDGRADALQGVEIVRERLRAARHARAIPLGGWVQRRKARRQTHHGVRV